MQILCSLEELTQQTRFQRQQVRLRAKVSNLVVYLLHMQNNVKLILKGEMPLITGMKGTAVSLDLSSSTKRVCFRYSLECSDGPS